MISCWMAGSSAPDMPLQVVQAKATMPKPSRSSSLSSPASFRYKATVLEPGARDDLTQGLRTSPSWLALRARRPAAITLRGLLVLVQLVMAAMITAPSGSRPSASWARALSRSTAMPRAARSATGRRRCGLEGPARVRTTVDKSKCSTRSYWALARQSAQRPASLA
ncbi:hypothetical protein D3C80_1115790 [compost metagenome]